MRLKGCEDDAGGASTAKIDLVTGGSILLFATAALAEIGGAYLVWIGIKEN